jgi:hypothetical protein
LSKTFFFFAEKTITNGVLKNGMLGSLILQGITPKAIWLLECDTNTLTGFLGPIDSAPIGSDTLTKLSQVQA